MAFICLGLNVLSALAIKHNNPASADDREARDN